MSDPSMPREAVRVLVTECTGQIAGDLVYMIATGLMLGSDQTVILQLLHSGTNVDVEALKALQLVLKDSVLPLLEDLTITTNVEQACKGVGFAILIGEFSRKTEAARWEMTSNSLENYKLQAAALEKHAATNCKVLVIADPANKLALTLEKFAPSIPNKNITCLTRHDHNWALSQISQKLDVPACKVKNVIIWGNHSSTQYPDVNHAMVNTLSGEYLARELINDDAWLNGEFIANLKERDADIIESRGVSRASAIAKAACDHIHDWVLGTREGRWVSMGVYSDGSYNVPVGLIHSFPVTCRNGEWTIVQGLQLDEFSRNKMDSTVKELMKQHLHNVASIERLSLGQCSA